MGETPQWVRIKAGDVFHIPPGAKHAFRNRARQPAVMIVISTSRQGRFFRDVGTPIAAGTPLVRPSDVCVEAAESYGHWNGTPEECADGLALSSM
jgi:uncharacterized cupin superfamily protein